jgi:hypothetical protein
MTVDILRKSTIEFAGEAVRKVGDASLLAVEATKTVRAAEIGRECGLFYVPRVLDFDRNKGVLELERLNGLETLLELAINKDARVLELMNRAGRALAVIHEQLTLPDKIKYPLPPDWMAQDSNSGSDRNVFIHGDFASVNVCLHEASGRLVILDWSAAPIVGRNPTFGSRYFDLLWFVACVFRGAPGARFLNWDVEGMADVFLRGYAKCSSHDISDGIKNYLPKICRLQRQKVWFLASRKSLLRATAYIGTRIFLHVRLCRFLRNYNL